MRDYARNALDEVLSAGSLPLDILERRIKHWVGGK